MGIVKSICSKPAAKTSSGLLVILAVASMVPLLFFPFSSDITYRQVYVVCYLLFIIEELCCYELYSKGDPSYSPFYFFSLTYVFMYSICPMYDIVRHEYLWFGYNVFGSGVSATVIAIIGYLAFFIAYSNTNKETRRQDDRPAGQLVKPSRIRFNFQIVIIFIWLFCLAANLFYMVAAGGNSILYCLTLGVLGDGGRETSGVSLGFISMFSYALPAATLLYCEYGKANWLIKAAMIYIMLALQVSRGFRFIVIQIVVMLFFYYRIRKHKYPNAGICVSVILLLLTSLLVMTMFRTSIRAGAGIDFSSVSGNALSDAFDDMFWENLRIYRNFYGMVDVIPSRFPFCFGDEVIIGTAVMLVPRILWPNKPSMYGGEGLTTLIGPGIASGQAYPALGEYYYALGLIAVVAFMALFGWWMRRAFQRYARSSNPLDNIVYVVYASSTLQLIIRGYMPSNFWFVIFAVLPIIIMKFIFGKIEID